MGRLEPTRGRHWPAARRCRRGRLVWTTLTAGLALILSPHVAAASTLTVVGHRGASTATIPENTAMAFRYAAHYADRLEADVRWTRNPVGPPRATMVLLHDPTLDRTTDCTGRVQDRYWSDVSVYCRTTVGDQPIMTLRSLLRFAASRHTALALELKVADITGGQARQFYTAVRATPKVAVTAFPGGTMDSLKKVKRLDAADSRHRLRYGYNAFAASPPSPAAVKAVATTVSVDKRISAARVAAYRAAGLRVLLRTGHTAPDYAMMLAKAPSAIVVDDPKHFRAWYRAQP